MRRGWKWAGPVLRCVLRCVGYAPCAPERLEGGGGERVEQQQQQEQCGGASGRSRNGGGGGTRPRPAAREGAHTELISARERSKVTGATRAFFITLPLPCALVAPPIVTSHGYPVRQTQRSKVTLLTSSFCRLESGFAPGTPAGDQRVETDEMRGFIVVMMMVIIVVAVRMEVMKMMVIKTVTKMSTKNNLPCQQTPVG